MGIMTRFARLCRADVHGFMDQLEDKGLVLKQHLREMEDELARKEARAGRMLGMKQSREQELSRTVRETGRIEEDLAAALESDRDDIARFLIKKLKTVEGQKRELEDFIAILDRGLEGLRECVRTQRGQYGQLRLQAAAFLHRAEQEAWRQTLSDFPAMAAGPDVSDEEVELELLRRKKSAGKEGAS